MKFDNHGRYGFYKCESCSGPIIGHLEVKCRALNGARYDQVTEKSFEDWLERIPEFRVAVAQRERKKEAKQAENQAGKLGEAVKAIMEGLQPTAQSVGQNGQMTQLMNRDGLLPGLGKVLKNGGKKWRNGPRTINRQKKISL